MRFSGYGLLVGLSFLLFDWIWQRHLLIVLPAKKHTRARFQLQRASWWIALGALLGARLYHLATDWSFYQNAPWWHLLAVWQGGLAVYGAVLGGGLGLWLWWRYTRPFWSLGQILDTAALAVPFAQALGRWGNYLNQELFGRPTSLPWGIFIDPAHRPATVMGVERFHPLFLYESLACLGIGLALQLLVRRGQSIFPVGSGVYLGWYLLAYGTVRFSLELLRLEVQPGWLGLTVGQWVSLGAVLLSLSLFAYHVHRQRQGSTIES